jgi:hypothetical protein
MYQRNFKLILLSILVGFGSVPMIVEAKYGLSETLNATKGLLPSSIGGASNVPELVGVFISIVLGFLGIIFFFLVFYAGFLWMTARGSQDSITKAKGMLEAAVVGLVIIVSAYAISKFIFDSLAKGTANVGGTTTETGEGKVTDCGGKKDGTVCEDTKVCKLETCVTQQDAACMEIKIKADCQSNDTCFWSGDYKAPCRGKES